MLIKVSKIFSGKKKKEKKEKKKKKKRFSEELTKPIQRSETAKLMR